MLAGVRELDRSSRVRSLGWNKGAPTGSAVQILVLLGRERIRREREAVRCRPWGQVCSLLLWEMGGSPAPAPEHSEGLICPVCRRPKLPGLPCPGSGDQGSCGLVSSVIILDRAGNAFNREFSEVLSLGCWGSGVGGSAGSWMQQPVGVHGGVASALLGG